MPVTFSADGAVGTITLDNPPANSYDIQFMLDLADTIGEANSHDAVRVVIVRSASERFFSAGADVKRFLANDVHANMEMISLAHEALASIARSPKPFVAWIAGHALGGGLEIALACDLRYAAEGSYRLGTPEVTLGLLPGNGGTQRLPRIIGRGPALDLLLTGRQIAPDEAHRLGIVAGLFADEDAFRSQVEKLASGPPLAIANIKRAVYQGLDQTLQDGLTLERELIEQLFRSRDANEGLTAFSEKRTPTFTGA
jgi:enoyl-CoA hydratase/carnithine racemase